MKKMLYSLIAALSLVGGVVFPAPHTFAVDVLSPACQTAPNSSACKANKNEARNGNALYGPNGLLTRAAGLIARVVGIAAMIMIIIAGFKYVTSSGDPSNVKSAKDTLLYALVGLLVAVTAQGLVVFVLSRL